MSRPLGYIDIEITFHISINFGNLKTSSGAWNRDFGSGATPWGGKACVHVQQPCAARNLLHANPLLPLGPRPELRARLTTGASTPSGGEAPHEKSFGDLPADRPVQELLIGLG
jgi:hypothetical protein